MKRSWAFVTRQRPCTLTYYGRSAVACRLEVILTCAGGCLISQGMLRRYGVACGHRTTPARVGCFNLLCSADRMVSAALVIYSFFLFLVEFLGGQTKVIQILAGKQPQKHLNPFCCLRSWRMGVDFFFNVKAGTLQYCVRCRPPCCCRTMGSSQSTYA